MKFDTTGSDKMSSDNDLLLYHYGDGLEADERDRIDAALRAQPELAARLRALVEQLDAATSMPEAPVPTHTQERWQAALERAARNETAAGASRPSFFSRHWRMAAVASGVLIAVVVVVGLRLGSNPVVDENGRSALSTEQVASATDAPRYEGGMRWHLVSTERQLARIDTASDRERAQLLDTVIAQNRLYAAAAERSGDQRLARALRSFTPILEDLAENSSGSGDSAGEIAQLNFELRVMQARLATETATTSPDAQPLTL
jgi:negative regulator of sigma E activity